MFYNLKSSYYIYLKKKKILWVLLLFSQWNTFSWLFWWLRSSILTQKKEKGEESRSKHSTFSMIWGDWYGKTTHVPFHPYQFLNTFDLCLILETLTIVLNLLIFMLSPTHQEFYPVLNAFSGYFIALIDDLEICVTSILTILRMIALILRSLQVLL